MSSNAMQSESGGWTTLVQAETLSQALGAEDIVVIDARAVLTDPAAGEAAYRTAHVPGAIYAHLDRDLSGPAHPQAGRHPWPDAATFTTTLSDWGIAPAHRVVAYDAGDGAYAARVWFLLRALGHRHVAVLDGGLARWLALGLPTEATIPQRVPQPYRAEFDAARLLDAAAVQSHLASGGMLIDARAAERFRGDIEPIDPVAGHVPGAVNRPFAINLADGRFKPAMMLAEEFTALIGAHAPDEVVVMCGSGVTACHHLLAMELAGLGGARLFTGSWSGWVADRSRPVATGGE